MKENRFSRYAGSKLHFCNRLNAIVKELKGSTTYVEPFFGSGAIFFNLEKEFDRYVINDTNKHVVNAVASFKHGTYDQYRKQIDFVAEKFGDIMKDKEAYYNFRNWFNAEYFGNGKDAQTEGFYFHFLMNSCINSLVRIGPNGFNQSYGNRFFTLTKPEFDEVNRRLQGNVFLVSGDYMKVLDEFDSDEAFFFLDPPYFARNTVGYEKTYEEDDLRKFLEKIKSMKGKVIYTDIECKLHAELGWHKELTKALSNISPNRRVETESQEVFFSNFVPVAVSKPTALF